MGETVQECNTTHSRQQKIRNQLPIVPIQRMGGLQ